LKKRDLQKMKPRTFFFCSLGYWQAQGWQSYSQREDDASDATVLVHLIDRTISVRKLTFPSM